MLNQQIYEEASEWFTRMRDGEEDPAAHNELMGWLSRSPEHVGAYLDIAAVWMGSKNVSVDAEVDPQTRISLARADREVTELLPDRTNLRRTLRERKRKLPLALVATAAFALLGIWMYDQRNTYSTDTGEQRSIVLADGSTVLLNSRSRLRVRFSTAERAIDLLEGQALFQVKKESAHPFIVRSDGASVRAVGTQFDVYRKHGGTIVTVVEGRVAVTPPLSATVNRLIATGDGVPSSLARQLSSQRVLGAGEQLTVAPQTAPLPVRVNVEAATAWTQRQLVFEFTPLSEVVEEFNRYNVHRLAVEGEALRAFKISAFFRSTDPGSLVRYMQTQRGIRVLDNGDITRIMPRTD